MEDKKGWSKNAHNPSCISFDDTNAHLGKTSLKINTTGYTVSYVQSDLLIPINNTAATEYTFSGWVKSDNPTAQLTLFKYEENKTTYTTESVNTTALGNWIFITKTVVVPANSKYLNLRVENVGTGTVWFDDVMIRKTANTALVNLQVPNDTYKDRKLIIDYNTFKAPVTISEAGVDKLSFVYNDNNDRSVMFYGSLDDTKTARPNRKYYSADGTMEIKQNIQTGEIEFVTYLGGDGYSAPVVYKKTFDTAGTAQEQMLYLHRDYQGSILAITDANAVVLEKRQFDAWGAILKVQDGNNNVLNGLTILDRGYTGHEHLQSVGLINMNGRLYDPKLHRFLQPDNYVQDASNTQNYNRYSYVLNNPLKYTDPSGEKWKITWSDIVSAVAIVAGTVLTFTGFPMIGVPLIGAGVAHFTTAINEFKQTGDWVSASNNAGFIVSFTVKTDFGYDSDNKPNGITQTEPVVKPIAADDVRNMGSGNNSAQQQARDRANGIYLLYRTNYDDFYGSKIMINSENGSNNWSFFGTIHTSKAWYDSYKAKGLNSKPGLLLMHEYGHWLHSQYNSLNWYSYGMWSSMATANSSTASSNWTEIKANTMAYYYFHYPAIFNTYKNDYPIDKNSISDELKYKLYYHLKP